MLMKLTPAVNIESQAYINFQKRAKNIDNNHIVCYIAYNII